MTHLGRDNGLEKNGVCDEKIPPIVVLQLCRGTQIGIGAHEAGPSALSRRRFIKSFLTHFSGVWAPRRRSWDSGDDRWTKALICESVGVPEQDGLALVLLVFRNHSLLLIWQTRWTSLLDEIGRV